jgi:hypothetical protein
MPNAVHDRQRLNALALFPPLPCIRRFDPGRTTCLLREQLAARDQREGTWSR